MFLKMFICGLFFCFVTATSFAGENYSNAFDREQLRLNFFKRLQPFVGGKKNAQKFTIEGIKILQAEPVALTDELTLYAVSVEIRHTNLKGEDVADTMLIVTDKTGRYQFGKIQELGSGYEAVLSQVPSLTAVILPDGLAHIVAKGTGSREVVFISDAFCPYCRQAFAYLLKNMERIHELKSAHLPLAMHPGADVAAWIMSYASEQNINPLEVMKFAYTELVLPQIQPSNSAELESIQKNIVAQFINKFPMLAQGQETDRFFERLKMDWQKKISDSVLALEKLKITGTPMIIVDGQAVSGFNQKELEQKFRQ